MPSKYKASIKVRLTRVFNVAVLVAAISLAIIVDIGFWKSEAIMVDETKKEVK